MTAPDARARADRLTGAANAPCRGRLRSTDVHLDERQRTWSRFVNRWTRLHESAHWTGERNERNPWRQRQGTGDHGAGRAGRARQVAGVGGTHRTAGRCPVFGGSALAGQICAVLGDPLRHCLVARAHLETGWRHRQGMHPDDASREDHHEERRRAERPAARRDSMRISHAYTVPGWGMSAACRRRHAVARRDRKDPRATPTGRRAGPAAAGSRR